MVGLEALLKEISTSPDMVVTLGSAILTIKSRQRERGNIYYSGVIIPVQFASEITAMGMPKWVQVVLA